MSEPDSCLSTSGAVLAPQTLTENLRPQWSHPADTMSGPAKSFAMAAAEALAVLLVAGSADVQSLPRLTRGRLANAGFCCGLLDAEQARRVAA